MHLINRGNERRTVKPIKAHSSRYCFGAKSLSSRPNRTVEFITTLYLHGIQLPRDNNNECIDVPDNALGDTKHHSRLCCSLIRFVVAYADSEIYERACAVSPHANLHSSRWSTWNIICKEEAFAEPHYMAVVPEPTSMIIYKEKTPVDSHHMAAVSGPTSISIYNEEAFAEPHYMSWRPCH